MGSFLNPLRIRQEGNQSRLPLYENVTTCPKERESSDSYDTDSEYDQHSGASSHSTRSRHTSRHPSRQATSALLSGPAQGMAKRFALPRPRRSGRATVYRLPSRLVRYLCIGLIFLVSLFILTLARASANENRRIREGKVTHAAPPPPLWESYSFLTRYYGGIRNLVDFRDNTAEYPRLVDELPIDKLDYVKNKTGDRRDVPAYTLPPSKEFVQYPHGVFVARPERLVECFVDQANKVRVPAIRYYEGRPNGFPEAVLGSYEALGLPEDICYERHGRYGPYGYGYSVRTGGLGIGEHGDKEGSELIWEKVPRTDWRPVNWADAQRRCYTANVNRYKPMPAMAPAPHGFYVDEATKPKVAARDEPVTASGEREKPDGKESAEIPKSSSTKSEEAAGMDRKLPRTAIVIRCWDEFIFKADDVMNLRSLIAEMALASGGRYDVHILVQVKNDALYPIWADNEVYEKRIRDVIPEEFAGLVTLWTETQMLALYQGIHDLFTRGPDLPVHGVYRGLQMAMQYFAYKHPEYEYFWQWEMDIRYTGHYYDLITKVENWAKEQPRKGLWERSERFYLPAVHGTWEDFKQMARVQAEMGTTGADNIWNGVPGTDQKKSEAQPPGSKLVWGPVRPVEESDWFEPDKDVQPETANEKDKYVWGVGEEADYITFNPMFDPEGTTWLLADDITGYNTTRGSPPRRAQIITASRMSRRLLLKMHRETAHKKRHAFPEMWPATVALQHGYKAVYIPHPLYVDREWPTEMLARTLNNGKNGASGGSRTSVFGQREHNLQGLTWFYNSGFAPNLYRRWLGLKVNNDGGPEFETTEDKSKNGATVGEMRGGEGRMCLPPMLLHPVKDVDLPVESIDVKVEVPASDPSA